MHMQGGNYIFVDGHAKSIKESLCQEPRRGPDGCCIANTGVDM
jgi:prepilin-type processing-associated H-X9-DG protein